jgi:predicted nucleic acid-binding protein
MQEAISDSSTLIHLAGIGRLELLIWAKLEGKVASLREELDRLRSEAGFWVGDEIYWQALKAVAEQ